MSGALLVWGEQGVGDKVLTVNLKAGFPLGEVKSGYHDVDIANLDDLSRRVTLKGVVVVRGWTLGGDRFDRALAAGRGLSSTDAAALVAATAVPGKAPRRAAVGEARAPLPPRGR